MKILAFPKYGDDRNPVLFNINKHLEKDVDLEIEEFSIVKPFTKKYDVFHIHWPDYFFVNSFFYSLLRIVYLFSIIGIFKCHRTKIIWTVHNLHPHNNFHPRFNKLIMNNFTKLIDGTIFMSEESKMLSCQEYPSLEKKKTTIIYHGAYDNYPNSINKAIAREKFKIDRNKKVILYFGLIKKYKNIFILIDEFNKIDSDDYILIIAGKAQDKRLEEEILTKINQKTTITCLEFIENDDVQYFFNASDLVVLPFENILNSGSAMLALSFKKPILCPSMGSLIELKNIFGDKVVITYDTLTYKTICESFEILEEPNSDILGKFDNKILSNKLKQYYLSL